MVESLVREFGRFFNIREGRASHEVIRKRILAGARIDGIHMCVLIVAMLIASIGLNTDSTEAVIGAMLICPLMESVLAIAYSLATVDRRLLSRSALDLLFQIVICLVTSTLYFALTPVATQTSELLTNSSPTIWDVLIAFAGGFAGAIGTSRNQEPPTLIAGVAVATALMPPLCATGYWLARKSLVYAVTALYEFGLNVVFIAFAAELVLMLLRVPPHRDLNGDGVVTPVEYDMSDRLSRQLRRRVVVGTIIFAIPCIFITGSVVHGTLFGDSSQTAVATDAYETELTTQELQIAIPGFQGYTIGTQDSYDPDSDSVNERVVATVVTTEELSDSEREQAESLVRLHVQNLDELTFSVSGNE